MRPTSVLALVSLIGCSGGSSEDTGTAPDCTDGAVQVGATACGLNDRGLFDQECMGGEWQDTDCIDPDECTDGALSAESCWDGRGAIEITCLEGVLTETTGCTLTAPALVSVDSAGTAADGASRDARISADGRWVVFTSDATNLVAGDDNAVADIFLRDLQTETTVRVSETAAGEDADRYAHTPSISGDGRYVAWTSGATNLVSSDTNTGDDVFLRDMQTGTIARVSMSATGVEADAGSWGGQVSTNGEFVVFGSAATNLVTGDDNGFGDIFVVERASGTVTRIAVDGSDSNSPRISGDGRFVAFANDATTVRGGGPPHLVYLHDRTDSTTTKISVSTTGVDAFEYCVVDDLSFDGGAISYFTGSSNLVADDTNGSQDVFLYDRLATTTTRESVKSDGSQGFRNASYSSLSSDGGVVVFQSSHAFVTEDTNAVTDIYLRDVSAGTTTLLTVNTTGGPANSGSVFPDLAEDVGHVVFQTAATDILAGDTNGLIDIVVMPTAP